MGRHLIVREIARGTIGPLFLARTQNESDIVDTLARVIPIPADLPAKDDQAIADAIWDSANVGHDMVLRVADVVAGNGWVTLVHDHHAGSLLSSMHWRAGDLGSSFPSDVAARIALDVLEGLEQSRGLCESNRIPWRPGSICMGSLYLCGDGRTRALDGQVMAALLRSERMRGLAGDRVCLAPEVLQDSREPDERTDVFAVGAVLWELLTGRELRPDQTAPVARVSEALPKGAQVPAGLVHALHRALDLDPDRRQATLRELAVELVMGAEKVATYEQVIDFAGQLMPFEIAFRRPTTPAPTAVAASVDNASAQPNDPNGGDASRPGVAASIETSTLDPPPEATRLAADAAKPRDEYVATAKALDDYVATAKPLDAPVAQTVSAVVSAPEAADRDLGKPRDGRLEQIDWPDDDASPKGALEPAKKSNGAKPLAEMKTDLNAARQATKSPGSIEGSPVIEIRPESRRPAEPGAKTVRRESNRASASPKAGAAAPAQVRASSRPAATKPVQATSTKETKARSPESQKRGGFQVSATTLILGFSTTVLAVVLIMILLQKNSGAPAAAVIAPPLSAVAPVERASAQSNVTPLSDQSSATHVQVTSASPVSAKHSNEAPPGPVEARVGPRRSGKAAVASTARGATKDDGANDTPKTSKKSGQFIPDEI